jgi:capsular polysaccharide biosynthesis protein
LDKTEVNPMELKHYWSIIWRRWWLIAALLAAVLVVSLVTYRAPVPVYQATLRFSVGIAGDAPVNAANGEGRSDVWLASEYLADDLSEVLKGGDFRQSVSEQTGVDIPAGTISASREHRIMTVTVTGGNRDNVIKIAEAVGAAVQDGGAEYFPQLSGVQAAAVLIDGPGVGQVGRSLKDKLDLPIRLLIALVAGVALAFLWDYMDNTVRGRAELEALNLPVLGEIPRPRRGKRA